MAVLYTTKVKVHGGRAGHARSDDGRLDLALVPPKEVSAERQGVNPEQLFAAGYAACFESSIRGAARRSGKTLSDASVEATVSLVSRDAGGFALEVALAVTTNGVTQQEATELVEQAHKVICPYSNAVRGNIDVQVSVVAN
jgi:osmotically inducible protein OsmC